MRVRSRESCFVLTYIPEPVLTNTRAGGLGASSHALVCRRPTFCLALTGNSGLKEEGGGESGEAGRRKDFSEHGNGPKGKHSSDSRCGNTLYTHTHTHIYTDTQIGGKEEVMRVIKQLLELRLASCDWLVRSSSELILFFFFSFFWRACRQSPLNKQTKDKDTKA